MPDREKVITALQLECEYPYSWECADKCPYYGKTDCDCYTQVAKDALELLKEQKPVEAKTMGESKLYGSWWFACGACGHAIDLEDNYCRECGRAVKWDDSDRNGNG
jgi:hypothetical protein